MFSWLKFKIYKIFCNKTTDDVANALTGIEAYENFKKSQNANKRRLKMYIQEIDEDIARSAGYGRFSTSCYVENITNKNDLRVLKQHFQDKGYVVKYKFDGKNKRFISDKNKRFIEISWNNWNKSKWRL